MHTVLRSLQNAFPFLRNFLIYSSGSFILQGMAIVLTPLWITYLSPAQYGSLELLTTLQNLTTLLIGFNVSPVISTTYFKLTPNERPLFIRQICTTVLYAILIALPPLFGVAYFIQRTFFHHTVSPLLIHMTLATGLIWIMIQVIYRLFALEKNAHQLALLQALYGSTMLAGNCLFVIGCGWQLTGALFIRLLAASGLCLVALTLRTDRILHPISLPLSRAFSYFKEGVPFYPLFCAEWFFMNGNQWLVAQHSGLHDVGIYALALKVGLLFQVVITTPLNNAYLPYLYQQYKAGSSILSAEHTNRTVMQYILTFLLFGSITGYYLTRPFVHYFLPTAYHPALGYILGILVGQILYIGTTFATYLLRYQKWTFTCAWITVASASLTVALSTVLIPRYGISGGIWATIAGNGLLFALALYYNMRAQTSHESGSGDERPQFMPAMKSHTLSPSVIAYHVGDIGFRTVEHTDNRWQQRLAQSLAQVIDPAARCTSECRHAYTVLFSDYAQFPHTTEVVIPQKAHGPTIPTSISYSDNTFHDAQKEYASRYDPETQVLRVWTNGTHLCVTNIIQSLLIKNNQSLIHGAALRVNNQTIVLPSFGGIGKTSLIAHAFTDRSIEVLGDDLALLATNGELTAYPRPLHLYPYHRSLFSDYFAAHPWPKNLSFSLWHRAARKVLRTVGLEEQLNRFISPYPYTLVPLSHLTTPNTRPTPLDCVVILERSRTIQTAQLTPLTHEEAATFITNNLSYELAGSFRQQCIEGIASNRVPTAPFSLLESTILKGIRATRCYRITIPHSSHPTELGSHILPLLQKITSHLPPPSQERHPSL